MPTCLRRTIRTLRYLVVIACFASPPLAIGSETVTYYHWDVLGSPVAATDAFGDLVWREAYRPYGERIKQDSAAQTNDRWYTGHPHDEDTGLTYMGARYYDPVLGRFMAVDPVAFTEENPQSFNRYAYANNNPYKYVDPDGRDAIAMVAYQRISGSGDVGWGWSRPYVIYGYEVYYAPGANLDQAIVNQPVGSFELTFDARMSDPTNRGSILGTEEMIAEVRDLRGLGTKHEIAITDVGAIEDIFTMSSGEERSAIRSHGGGPNASLGCPTSPSHTWQQGQEVEGIMREAFPSLQRPMENTYIQIPSSFGSY